MANQSQYPKPSVKVAACQLPVVHENVSEAISWIEQFAQRAAMQHASLGCFPECCLQGYLVEENVARHCAMNLQSPEFNSVLQRLAHLEPTLVFGLIEEEGGQSFNTAVVIHNCQLIGKYQKTNLLPGESSFTAGSSFPVFEVGNLTFGINICSDTRIAEPAMAVASKNATLILCPANNMMKRENAEKWKHQHNPVRAQRAMESGCWIISADVTGECEDEISYGPTAIINPEGEVVAQVPLMEVGMVVFDLPCTRRQ